MGEKKIDETLHTIKCQNCGMVNSFLITKKGIETMAKRLGYRKESDTARELAKTIKSVVWEEFENETIRIKDLHGVIDDILRSKYGVDLGE